MLNTTFDRALRRLWGDHIEPGSFFTLVVETQPAAATRSEISLARKFCAAANDLSREIDMLDYGYFDLLREKGYVPGALPRPANDNIGKAAA